MILVDLMWYALIYWASSEVRATVLTYRDIYKLRSLNDGRQDSGNR